MQVMQVSFRPVLAKMADSQNRPASAILLRKSWNHTCITCITCTPLQACPDLVHGGRSRPLEDDEGKLLMLSELRQILVRPG